MLGDQSDGVNGIAVPLLPDEILSLICLELGNDRDFGSLYRCAQSAPILADPALRTMYLVHELSPTFIQSDEEKIGQQGEAFDVKLRQQEEFFRKWTVLWRSIVASSLGEHGTYRPYCRYLRILDFRNLTLMLEDFKFSGPIRKAFFAGSLSHLHFPKREFKRQGIDAVATINAIGETVIPRTYLLEEIAGQLSPGFLSRWIGQSPRLQSLVLFKGDALSSGAGAAIAEHCIDFKNITIHEWMNPDADTVHAECLNDMKENTIQYFEMISYNTLGPESFQALGRHKSLRDLRLGNLGQEAILNLNKLKDCTEIETLALHDNFGTVQLESLNNDVFMEVVQWLSSCEKLRDITLKKFFDGPAILAQVAIAPGVRLTRLALEGYVVRQQSAAAFHAALSEQKSLESLSLRGNGEDTSPADLTIMVEALSCLTNLKELVLKDVSDEFEETHIATIALSLPNLEEFWTSGQEVSDGLLDALSNLRQLTNLNLYALTQFSVDAILGFLSSLDPVSQKGFNLFLMAADPDYDLTEGEQEIIRDFVRVNLGGRFDFVLWREAESSDSEDD